MNACKRKCSDAHNASESDIFGGVSNKIHSSQIRKIYSLKFARLINKKYLIQLGMEKIQFTDI